jgi:hypothetical protein
VVTDPGHTHTTTYQAFNGSGGGGVAGGSSGFGTIALNTATTGITVATTNASVGSGTSFSILNPYYALAYIMKL